MPWHCRNRESDKQLDKEKTINYHACMRISHDHLRKGILIESTYLKTFIEVVKTGSFTKAAEKLCVSQSAVSRRIQFLENQYDCSLLDRSDPVLKQTHEGQLLLDKATQILEIEQDLERGLSKIQGGKTLNFICTPTFGTIFLPEIMKNFFRLHPGSANLKFTFAMPGAIRDHMQNCLFELAVIEHCHCFDLPDFETVDLPEDDLVFAISPELNVPIAGTTCEDLFKHTLLACPEECCGRVLLRKNLKAIDRTEAEFLRIVEFDSLELILNSVIAGDGIAYVSRDLLDPYVEDGVLQAVKLPSFVHYRKRTLIVPALTAECDLTRQFADTIVAYFDLPVPCQLQ